MKDWRITNQEEYLSNERLRWVKYRPSNPNNDHDHCEFCWSKFMTDSGEDIFDEGYSTEDGYRWICKTCFEDFKHEFHWEVVQ